MSGTKSKLTQWALVQFHTLSILSALGILTLAGCTPQSAGIWADIAGQAAGQAAHDAVSTAGADQAPTITDGGAGSSGGQQYDSSGQPIVSGGQQYDSSGQPIVSGGQQYDSSGQPIVSGSQQYDSSGQPSGGQADIPTPSAPTTQQPATPSLVFQTFPVSGAQQAVVAAARAPVSFIWSSSGPIPRMDCIQFHESREIPAHGWNDNFLCSSQNVGMRWSSNGPTPGYRCTQISEAREPAATSWGDNFVCVPPNSPIHFRYQSNGPAPGMQCVQLNEPKDPHTWNDNFLCY